MSHIAICFSGHCLLSGIAQGQGRGVDDRPDVAPTPHCVDRSPLGVPTRRPADTPLAEQDLAPGPEDTRQNDITVHHVLGHAQDSAHIHDLPYEDAHSHDPDREIAGDHL